MNIFVQLCLHTQLRNIHNRLDGSSRNLALRVKEIAHQSLVLRANLVQGELSTNLLECIRKR